MAAEPLFLAARDAQRKKNKTPNKRISRRAGREEWMASVAISDVRKAFGATAVIHGIDVAIRDGEFVVLVGPSGCGKSTLLRMVAGLENITSGVIRIGDRVVTTCRRKSGTLRWCSRITPSIRT